MSSTLRELADETGNLSRIRRIADAHSVEDLAEALKLKHQIMAEENQRLALVASKPKLVFIHDMEIEELDLGVRAFNRLTEAGIKKLSDLLPYSRKELLALRGFGRRCLEWLEHQLASRGYSLSEE